MGRLRFPLLLALLALALTSCTSRVTTELPLQLQRDGSYRLAAERVTVTATIDGHAARAVANDDRLAEFVGRMQQAGAGVEVTTPDDDTLELVFTWPAERLGELSDMTGVAGVSSDTDGTIAVTVVPPTTLASALTLDDPTLDTTARALTQLHVVVRVVDGSVDGVDVPAHVGVDQAGSAVRFEMSLLDVTAPMVLRVHTRPTPTPWPALLAAAVVAALAAAVFASRRAAAR